MDDARTRLFDKPIHAAIFTFAALVIGIAGLRAASPFLVPLMAAGFIALIVSSGVAYLRSTRLPDWAAIPIAIVLALVVGGIIALIVTITANQMASGELELQELLTERMNAVTEWINKTLSGLGLNVEFSSIASSFQLKDVAGQMRSVLNKFGGFVSSTALFILFMIFMLIESRSLPAKVRTIAGDRAMEDGGQVHEIVHSVQMYLIVKTAVAAMTGTAAGLACWAIGVPYAPFWGFLAFLFDFIPAFGAFFAAIPAAILALLVLGPLQALLTLGAFLAVNAGVGNFIEPRLHGRNQSMSPLFVLLSLVFWGWVFGPVGMLLAVPLTMILKISLEGTGEFNAFTVLVSSRTNDEESPTVG